MKLEVIVEELSAERALRLLLPRIVPDIEFDVRVFRGKPEILRKLPDRLRGYATWVGAADTRLVVLVDRDDDDCKLLKAKLELMAATAGLRTITAASASERADVINRIVVEELEAWFFGDVPAIRVAYPRIPASLGQQASYRNPDAIAGGTWEALARVLKKYGYHQGGLAKVSAATEIARAMNVDFNCSRSFQVFRDGLRRLVSGGGNAAEG